MIELKTKIAADTGKALMVGIIPYLTLPLGSYYTEEKEISDNVKLRRGTLYLDMVQLPNLSGMTYSEVLQNLIHIRYSNDDQIAIILNKDSDIGSYMEMQIWRDYCKSIAKKVIQVYDERKNK